jgi:hypothetical protein
MSGTVGHKRAVVDALEPQFDVNRVEMTVT